MTLPANRDASEFALLEPSPWLAEAKNREPDSTRLISAADQPLHVLRAIMAMENIHQMMGYFEAWLHSYISYDFLGCALWRSDFITDPTDTASGALKLELFGNEWNIELLESGQWREKTPVCLNLPAMAKHFPVTAESMKSLGLNSCCVAGLGFGDKATGALILGRVGDDGFSEAALREMDGAAAILSLILDRHIAADVERRTQAIVEDNRNHLQVMRQVIKTVISELDLHCMFYKVSGFLRDILKVEYSDLMLFNPAEKKGLRLAVSDHGSSLVKENEYSDATGILLAQQSLQITQPGVHCLAEIEEYAANGIEEFQVFLRHGFQELCSVPLISRGGFLGMLNIWSSVPGQFTSERMSLLSEIGQPIAMALENALTYRKVLELRNKLAREKKYLQGEIHARWRFEEIIGESPALKSVLDEVEAIGDSDANVLIIGETGTGKELIARALHELSTRKGCTFVKFNCAAIPAGLLESELFGHERGAFTGAAAARAGLMEVANKGTLFLDEVGDLPLELQPKLLRVLQEQQFSRLGSNRTIQADVRIIAATNRDLKQMMADHQFRSDLFYRLNVVPIKIPPLRERREDIPLLVHYFVQKYARIRRRPVETIPTETMQAFLQWNWPGNIRELEHLIERSVIMSKGSVLQVPLDSLKGGPCPAVQAVEQALPRGLNLSPKGNAEREAILAALNSSNGMIAGPRGAAAKLGLNRSTLLYRMQRLGIAAKGEYS